MINVRRDYVSLLERGLASVSINVLYRLTRVLGSQPSQRLKQVAIRVRKDHEKKRRSS